MIRIKYKFERGDTRVCELDSQQTLKTIEEVQYAVLAKKHPTLLKEIESHITHRLMSKSDHLRYVCDATPIVTIEARAARDVVMPAHRLPFHHGQNLSPEKVKELIKERLPELLAADRPSA